MLGKLTLGLFRCYFNLLTVFSYLYVSCQMLLLFHPLDKFMFVKTLHTLAFPFYT